MISDRFKFIQSLYKKYFNIPKRVVDMIACEEILKWCCEGISTPTIIKLSQFEKEYVENILLKYYGNTGYNITLDINPLMMYNISNGIFDEYVTNVEKRTNHFDYKLLNKSYLICKKYTNILKEIDEYYI